MKQAFFSYLLIISTVNSVSGAEFQANTSTTYDQSDAAIAADPNGNFIIVWSSYRQDSNSGGVFGRLFDANCTPRGDEFQINTTTVGNQTEPAVAMSEGGNFLAVWHGPNLNQEDIFARRFDRNGQPLGSEFTVNSDPNGRDLHPKAAMSKTGAFVIVWENNQTVQQLDFWEALYKIYDSNATPVAEGKVNLLFRARYPDVAMDSNGAFTVVWVQDDIYHSYNLIMFRQYNADAIEQTDPCQVNTTNFNTLTQPSIAMDATRHFIVAWDGHPETAGKDDIYARRYKFDATPLTDQFLVNSITAGAQQRPKAAMNNQHDFVIVWNSETQPGSNVRDILGQRYDCSSCPVGDQFRVNSYVVNDQKYPAVVLKENGRFISAWQSYGQDGSGYGIFADTGPKTGCADFNNDGFVNFLDFCFLAEQWLENENPLTADLIDDNKIDPFDLAAFCPQWLRPRYWCTELDINNDSRIDFRDYRFLANNWLKQAPNLAGDITGNGIVDMTDLHALLYQWPDNCLQ